MTKAVVGGMRFLAGSHMSRNVRKHPEAGKFKKTNSP
jgi:hypothetical protein